MAAEVKSSTTELHRGKGSQAATPQATEGDPGDDLKGEIYIRMSSLRTSV